MKHVLGASRPSKSNRFSKMLWAERKKKLPLRLGKARRIRAARIYLARAFYFLALVSVCAVLVVISSERIRSWMLGYVDKASANVGCVVKDIAVHNKNSAEHCLDLSHIEALRGYYGRSMFTVSIQNLAENLRSIDCISNVESRKVFPSSVQVMVSYQEPIAIWRDKKEFHFVTSEGNLMRILNDSGLNSFVMILGDDAPRNVPALMKFMSQDQELYSNIDKAAWIGNRRWDVIFRDGRRVKLPEDNPEIAWNKFVNLQRDHPDFAPGKYKTIDFRVAGKVYAS
jgi:cell division protein FtsQ